MAFRIGSRTFAPRPLTTSIAFLLFIALLLAGRWQLQRAEEKRALFDEFAAGNRSVARINSRSAVLTRYASLLARGHYASSEQVLIDNMVSSEGQAGYDVITPFELDDGGWLLVNRGWISSGANRAVLPDIAVAENARSIRGRADLLPRPGIRLGSPPVLAPPFPVRASYPTAAQVRALLTPRRWAPAAEAVLLDAHEPDGFERHWNAPGFPPLRHIAYAVQWFALAAALVVIYFITNLKK